MRKPKPYSWSYKVGRQNAKRWRLIRKGLTGHETKAEMRAIAERAIAEFRKSRI